MTTVFSAPKPATTPLSPSVRLIPSRLLQCSPFSMAVYGEPQVDADGLLVSIREQGILVPLVVVSEGSGWQVVSGHRRLTCARALGMEKVPCQVRSIPPGASFERAVIEYNLQRCKSFSQIMREADALEALLAGEARRRRTANLRQNWGADDGPECRNQDGRGEGRTDVAVARTLGLGGKDLYRQARAIWRAAQGNDPRARGSVAALDAGTKTIHAAYKDLRRRDRFSAGFRPTPYDVWSFRHDSAFGLTRPGSIPAAIVAHTLHYFTAPGDLVVDPMAGGGTTIDVCEAMGRRCLAFDIDPARPEVKRLDVTAGLPTEALGCDLIFCDPPYHTMLARRWHGEPDGVEVLPLDGWVAFLGGLARDAFAALRPGGHIALLLANQTEKDLPPGLGYLDHSFLGYQSLVASGFLPQRRISCPMSGAYLPQQVSRARTEGRLLGQVRDLLVMRKPGDGENPLAGRLAAGQFVDLGPHERVGESGIAPDQRVG
jgi:ParB family transcriptional regulator, chromosome partitioning protein